MNIFDVRENLDTIVFDHEQQIKDLAAQLLELRQLVTPMMEFKQPTKICGPNLEETLNAAGFYRKKEWVGLTREELAEIFANCDLDERGAVAHMVEVKLRNKNS